MTVPDAAASFAVSERSGFALSGWALNGKLYDFSAPVTEDITLTAVWVETVAGPTESFENGSMPDGWSGHRWFINYWYYGGYNYHGAHSGRYFVYHYGEGNADFVMPAADLSRCSGANLTFWYMNFYDYEGYYDEILTGYDHLSVAYRVNGGEKHELFCTTEEHKGWTQATVLLPAEAMREMWRSFFV